MAVDNIARALAAKAMAGGGAGAVTPEDLEKKYYSEEASQKEKDEYSLEAGKLITEELLHNTKDNAGLL